MTVINRYSIIKRGSIYITGNTLGLAGNSSFQPSGPGNVQAFITTDTTVATAPGWSSIINLANDENVTNQWTVNSASAYLNLPENSEILYAELIWPSSVSYSSTILPITIQNTSVKLTAPDNTLSLILPDTITMQSVILSPPASQFNLRSADVTDLVKSKGNGKYIIGGVPCYLNYPGNVALGWSLVIAYENILLPWRSLSVNVCNELVNPSTTVYVPISGFITPSVGVVDGRVALVATEGDNWNGDSVSFGPSPSSFTVLSGPNNPSSNFFSSQINNNTGNLNTTGTFGTRNFYPPGATTPIGSRQGFDITNVSINNILPNNQNSGVFRFQTSSDGYIINSIAMQVDINSANLTPIIKLANKNFCIVGDTISYTIVLNNSGSTTALNVIFLDTISSEASFINNSVTINGVSYPSYNPNPPGFSVNNISAKQSSTITFSILVNSISSSNRIENQAYTSYSFIIGDTIPAILDSSLSSIETTTIVNSILTTEKIASKNYCTLGDEITYSVIIKNLGNTSAVNIIFIDTLPNGTSLILGSLKQDTTTIVYINNPIITTLPNNLQAGATSTISYRISVDSLPISNSINNVSTIKNRFIVNPIDQTLSTIELSTITNIVTTTILNAGLNNVKKTVNKNYAIPGDTLTYTIQISNEGNILVHNCIFYDTIPSGTKFIENTLSINNTIQLGANPILGVNIGTIPVGAMMTLSFSVLIQ